MSLGEIDCEMFLNGIHIDESHIPELARLLRPALARKLTVALSLRSKVVPLTVAEQCEIRAALEHAGPQLEAMRNAALSGIVMAAAAGRQQLGGEAGHLLVTTEAPAVLLSPPDLLRY